MPDKVSLELDESTFACLRERIQGYSGIYLDESRRRSLARQASARLARRGLRSWNEYLALFDSPAGPEEMSGLLEEVVNNETTFFRNPRHFRLLAEVVLPELDRLRPAGQPLRLWSAGCSTGQEPYSLAMTVAEALGVPPRRPVEILATDISRRALEYARAGLYTAREMQRVEMPYRKSYFLEERGGQRIHPALHQLVNFQPLNLVQPLPAFVHNVDIILCRNVTIYFQVETSRRLMANLYGALNQGGYLFIGFSETLWQIFDAFERVQSGGVFYYRKGSAGRPRQPQQGKAPARVVSAPVSVERPLYLGPAPAKQPHRRAPAETKAERQSAHHHYHRGMTCLRDGLYKEALDAFHAALREEPNLVEAHCGIAQVYANQARYAEAQLACEHALELDDLAEEAYLLRGLVYRQMGKTEEAVADLERAAYLNPSSPTALFHLGDALLALPDGDRALQAFRRTARALLGQPEDALIDGVPVHMLRQACSQRVKGLETGPGRHRPG